MRHLKNEAPIYMRAGPLYSDNGQAVQAQLALDGGAQDPLEQEADRTADTVMRQPADPARIDEKDTPAIQRSAPAAAPADAGVTLPKSGGQALPDSERSFFEPRFGRSFAGVRVHNDEAAHQFSARIGANAATAGRDIYFRAGQYRPGTPEGRRLLAHELTHTVQQGKGGTARVQRESTSREKQTRNPALPQNQLVNLEDAPSGTTIKKELRMPYGPNPNDLNGWAVVSRRDGEAEYTKTIQFESKEGKSVMYIVRDRRDRTGLHRRTRYRYVNGAFTLLNHDNWREVNGAFQYAHGTGGGFSSTDSKKLPASGVRVFIAWYVEIPGAKRTSGTPTHRRAHLEAYDSGSGEVLGMISNSGSFTRAMRGDTGTFPDQRRDTTQPEGWYMANIRDVMPGFYSGQKGDWGSDLVPGDANSRGFHLVYEGQPLQWTPPRPVGTNW